jgi:hypothetical protein
MMADKGSRYILDFDIGGDGPDKLQSIIDALAGIESQVGRTGNAIDDALGVGALAAASELSAKMAEFSFGVLGMFAGGFANAVKAVMPMESLLMRTQSATKLSAEATRALVTDWQTLAALTPFTEEQDWV